jgi:poly(A) polymerase
LNDRDLSSSPGPTIIPRAEHAISRADISESALKVLYRLKKAGYAAFVVGGGVRDLLLGLHPKDFDIVTNAHPEDVRRLFRNSRLIGRRFRLAHVRFGREIIEVATFRAAVSADDDDREHHARTGRILRDNVYGTIDEDIWRRDFTVNALYYNIDDFSIRDYTTGTEDIRARRLRLIGDPETRYREDPVRMLRALRLAAKLDFTIGDESAAPLSRLGPLLGEVPPARIFDEVLKLFQTGHAVASYEKLCEFSLIGQVFPGLGRRLAGPEKADIDRFVRAGLENTDRRVADGKSVTPMFLFAVMLWPAVRQRAETLAQSGKHTALQATTGAIGEVMTEQLSRTALPKRFSAPMREIMQLQHRFERTRGARVRRFLQHPRFRAAYDFLVLRDRCGEVDPGLADWWTEAQSGQAVGADPEPRKRKTGGRRRRGRRRGGGRRTGKEA